jgi:hypothetical protein
MKNRAVLPFMSIKSKTNVKVYIVYIVFVPVLFPLYSSTFDSVRKGLDAIIRQTFLHLPIISQPATTPSLHLLFQYKNQTESSPHHVGSTFGGSTSSSREKSN